MYGRLSVFLSLVVFVSAAPSYSISGRVPVRKIADEDLPTNRAPPAPAYRYGYGMSNGAVSGSYSRLYANNQPGNIYLPTWLPKDRQSIEDESSSWEMGPDGSYLYAFETGDGIKNPESGSQGNVRPEDFGDAFWALYPDGGLRVNWVADENGFQPTGDHLPIPPPLPEDM